MMGHYFFLILTFLKLLFILFETLKSSTKKLMDFFAFSYEYVSIKVIYKVVRSKQMTHLH